MDTFIDKVREIPAFNHIDSIEEFEDMFELFFKRKCTKCKKNMFNTHFSPKPNGQMFKMCNECRAIMRGFMRRKNILHQIMEEDQ
jgi:hypothetical protein